MRKVGIRQFARHFYTEIQDLPVTITAKKKPVYIVMAIEETPEVVTSGYIATPIPDVQPVVTTNSTEPTFVDLRPEDIKGNYDVTVTADQERARSDILDIQDSPTTFTPASQTVSDQEISDARTNGWTEKLKKKIFG